MAGNQFGEVFKLTTFGESHGKSIGGIIEGCPAGIEVDLQKIQHELDRRKPGQSNIVTQRKESDEVVFQSGIFEGKTTGTPIGFIINNQDQKSKDYSHIKDVYRPSHADFTYQQKYQNRDYRGGGRSSARETACRVVAGALAKQFLQDIYVAAYTKSIGHLTFSTPLDQIELSKVDQFTTRCPDETMHQQMEDLIKKVRKQGDTIGGVVKGVIKNVPVGLGEPVFDKLHAQLGKAMLSINAVKGFQYGSGFEGTKMKGSEHNDIFQQDQTTTTNYSGGIQGGISNGMAIYFDVAFKPVATLLSKQDTINEAGEKVEMQGKGRHDPCVVPRAVAIVEAMAALVIADFVLLNRLSTI
ncbi:MAG: chorismate synthase [Psychroflexus sp.]|nr:chorismate synthase [Psychroflexus sp.]MDR9449186.1 chorismate synthase [Psychroflexus sp.]